MDNSNKNRILALLFFLLFVPAQGIAQSNAELVEQYKKAIASPVPQKIALLRDIISKDSHFLEAWYALGGTYYEQANFLAAIPCFEYLLARPQEVAKRPSLASLVEKLNLPGLVATAYNIVGSRYIEQARPDSAIFMLKRAIELDGTKAIFYNTLGLAYLKKAQYREALDALRESLKLDKNSAVAWFNLGTTYWYLQEYENAIDAYNRGLEIDPENRSALANLAKAREKVRTARLLARADSAMSAGNPSLAISVLNQIKKIDPSLAQVDNKLAAARQEQRYQEALAAHRAGDWQAALKMLDALPSGYKDREQLRVTAQQKLAENQQQHREQTLQRANRLLARGRYNEARRVLESQLQTEPGDLRAAALLSRLDSLETAAEQARLAAASIENKTSSMAGQDSSMSTSPDTALASSLSASAPAGQTGPPAKNKTARRSDRTKAQQASQTPGTGTILVLIAVAMLFSMTMFFYRMHRRRQALKQHTPAATLKSEEAELAGQENATVFVKAAVERVDLRDLDRSSDSSHQKFFEQLVDDQVLKDEPLEDESGSVEIREIESQEGESELEEQKSSSLNARMHESLAAEEEPDSDDFLAIIEESELDESEYAPDVSVPVDDEQDETEATHTVDMSQFKTRRIGRYIIEKEIGRGAAGRIYKAWDPKLDRTVVIKTVSYSLTASDDEIRRLKARVYREARAAAKLNHPNIVVVYDVEDEPTFSYIVMEHIEGPDLKELLSLENKISPDRTLHIISQVCKALNFSHSAGIIHRDIKPSNILVVEKDKVKVTDFGIAKVSNHMTLTQTGRVVGTPSYMAPEQIEGADVDGRADIFSVGVVFYELLTGQRPFVGESLAALAYKIVHVEPTPPSLINLDLPDIFDEIVSRAMAKDPADRYQTVADMLTDLQRARSIIKR